MSAFCSSQDNLCTLQANCTFFASARYKLDTHACRTGESALRGKLVLAVCLFLLICLGTPVAQAADVVPFATTNLNPFAQLFGLAFPTAPARQQATQTVDVRLQQEVANNFSLSQRGNETLIVDGEIWRTSVNFGYRPAANWHLGLSLPFTRHSKGFMDGLISDWHDWFGFPQGDREKRSDDSLLYFYQAGTQRLARVRQTQQGLGDVTLAVTHERGLFQREAFATFSIKLPTGEAARFTGSDATDVAFSALLRDSTSFSARKSAWFVGGGIARLGQAESPLRQRQNRWVWMTRVGGGWHLTPSVQLKAQLDHHTAVYSSEMRALGRQAVQLTAGVSWLPSPTTQLDLALSEDLMTTVSPDISLLSALHLRF